MGLAAGLDKDAEVFEGFGSIGFGFVEVGTVTALAQPGNPRPRLFRLPADRALLNRMGFNNHGASAAARRLARPRRTVVGANIGRSKVTPNEQAVA
ncbi:MAG TPA: dihydroorotate dehydrogenase (quinone), partial [Marmoricola sp.]|nr:dihydroorotate dehydrogenase (quinone) [Marmoricola sp.]